MTRTKLAFFGVLFSLLFCVTLEASDAYVWLFNARGKSTGSEPQPIVTDWFGTVYLYNRNAAPVDVRLLGISNGGIPPGAPTTLTLPPNRIVVLPAAVLDWYPPVATIMFVLHLDIPP